MRWYWTSWCSVTSGSVSSFSSCSSCAASSSPSSVVGSTAGLTVCWGEGLRDCQIGQIIVGSLDSSRHTIAKRRTTEAHPTHNKDEDYSQEPNLDKDDSLHRFRRFATTSIVGITVHARDTSVNTSDTVTGLNGRESSDRPTTTFLLGSNSTIRISHGPKVVVAGCTQLRNA